MLKLPSCHVQSKQEEYPKQYNAFKRGIPYIIGALSLGDVGRVLAGL